MAASATSTPAANAIAVDRTRGGSTHDPLQVTVACPTCHERLRVTAGQKPGKIACTFCGSSVPVPERDAVARWKARKVAPQIKEVIGEYSHAAPVPLPPLRTDLFDRLAEIRTEPPAPPPRWAFFSGVFTFPWRANVVFRWGGMSLGFTLAALIGLFVASGGAGVGVAGLGVVAIGFFILPLLWIVILTISFSANCFLCVLESTGHGLDQIEAWPEGGWKEWMPSLFYLTWIAVLPVLTCFGLGRLAQLAGVTQWPVVYALLFVLFPMVLLSALEAGSVWVPLTRPIARSLIFLGWGWLLFYLLTGLMAAALGALAVFGWPRFAYLSALALGLLLPAYLLIYARLLGRLAWRIGQTLTA